MHQFQIARSTLLKKAAVVSHERSGTHFLMNTLSENFGYSVTPWWNFDFNLPINFHADIAIQKELGKVHDKPAVNLLKSHHPASFFRGSIEYLCDQFHVFYIYRDPRDVIVSNWKLTQSFEWNEGPETDSPGAFMRMSPSGAMLRYQQAPERNMLDRWYRHVSGWLELSESRTDLPIKVIRYEDLTAGFEEQVDSIADFMNLERRPWTRPSSTKNVVGKGPAKVGGQRHLLDDRDERFIVDEHGWFLRQLGYL